MQKILVVYFGNSTKSSCNSLFKLTTHLKTTAVKVIRDEKKKALYWSVNVLSTNVLIADTIFTSHIGDGTAILRGHPSNTKVWPFAAGQR